MSGKRLLLVAALCTLGGVLPAPGLARVPEPHLGRFEAQDLARVRLALPAAQAAPVEASRECATPSGLESPLAGGTDNDACHYMRGSTIIVHIFMDSPGQVWDATARAEAGGKAHDAKQYYLTFAPPAANVSFDHQGTYEYVHYQVALDHAPTFAFGGFSDADLALQLIGVTDDDSDGLLIDDFTLALQSWGGGWDNVIAVFEPKVAPSGAKSFASFGQARCYMNPTHGSALWAHEWGHCFGSCDEYSVHEPNCDPEQDPSLCNHCPQRCEALCNPNYTIDPAANGNCVTCGASQDCLMRNYFTTVGPCPFTSSHWAWLDNDADGLLDAVKGTIGQAQYVDIVELPHDVARASSDVTNGWVYAQRPRCWASVGLRSPATANDDLELYGDNNHRYLYAASRESAGLVDLVVGDYRRTNPGNEHVRVFRASGDGAAYTISWEGGADSLLADGVIRTVTWSAGNVVKTWDLPLAAGQQVVIDVAVTGGGLDPGAAIFRSDTSHAFFGRSGAAALRDTGGPGAAEHLTYAVPDTAAYGLVVWSNTSAGGSLTIRVRTDTLPPAQITDLGIDSEDCPTASAVLGWTAPGDDGNVGRATAYDLRASSSPITAGNFANATHIATDPAQPAGVHETIEVGIGFGRRRYFAIKALDENLNASPMSNAISALGPPSPDNCVEPAARVGPPALELLPPEPNPARGALSIRYGVPATGIGQDLEVTVYDLAGRMIRRIASGRARVGYEAVHWNLTDAHGRAVVRGVYFIRVRLGDRWTERRAAVVW